MRRWIGVFLIGLLSLTSAASAETAPEVEKTWVKERITSYFGPNGKHRVSIESENGLVSTIDVPNGVVLSVVASEFIRMDSSESSENPCYYRGDVLIRARRYDEVQDTESSSGRDMMAKAPLAITLHDVVVTVVKVE